MHVCAYVFKRVMKTKDVRAAIKLTFPQFRPSIERRQDHKSFTVRFRHLIRNDEKHQIREVLKELDKTGQDWRREWGQAKAPDAQSKNDNQKWQMVAKKLFGDCEPPPE